MNHKLRWIIMKAVWVSGRFESRYFAAIGDMVLGPVEVHVPRAVWSEHREDAMEFDCRKEAIRMSHVVGGSPVLRRSHVVRPDEAFALLAERGLA